MNNPKMHHKRMCQFNGARQHGNVRVRRINKELKRIKLARASLVPAARLVSNGKIIKVSIKLPAIPAIAA